MQYGFESKFLLAYVKILLFAINFIETRNMNVVLEKKIVVFDKTFWYT